jgi:hypothetical protein
MVPESVLPRIRMIQKKEIRMVTAMLLRLPTETCQEFMIIPCQYPTPIFMAGAIYCMIGTNMNLSGRITIN